MCKKKGFTLIELLVVVSIIALLVSILLPALNKAREQAKAIVCLSTAKSFGTANEVYAASYDGYFVPYSQPPVDSTQTWGARWVEITQFREILAMQKSEDLWEDAYIFPEGLLCPSHKIAISDEYLDNDMKSAFGYKWRTSIGYNVEYWTHLDFDVQRNGGFPGPKEMRAMKSSSIRSASEKMQWIDAVSYDVRRAWADYDPETSFWGQYGEDVAAAGRATGNSYPYPWAVRFYSAYRHDDQANLVFFDGHGEKMQKEDVFDVSIPSSLQKFDRDVRDPLWDVKWPLAGM